MFNNLMHALLVFLVVYLLVSGSKACIEPAAAKTTAQTEQATSTVTPDTGEVLAVTVSNGNTTIPLTVEQYQAISRIHTSRRFDLTMIAWCESRIDPSAIGDGGLSLGAWQVQPRFWGTVPSTIEEQADQADRIAAEHGFKPWTTFQGCEGWRK